MVADDDLRSYLTHKRNTIKHRALVTGYSVQYPFGDSSLEPLIVAGDTCFIYPTTGFDIQVGDIVFCQAQWSNKYFVNLVWQIVTHYDSDNTPTDYYMIGNNKPQGRARRCNGWCLAEHIIGMLIGTTRGGCNPLRKTIFKEETDDYECQTCHEYIPFIRKTLRPSPSFD